MKIDTPLTTSFIRHYTPEELFPKPAMPPTETFEKGGVLQEVVKRASRVKPYQVLLLGVTVFSAYLIYQYVTKKENGPKVLPATGVEEKTTSENATDTKPTDSATASQA